jgi:hypothetical protein
MFQLTNKNQKYRLILDQVSQTVITGFLEWSWVFLQHRSTRSNEKSQESKQPKEHENLIEKQVRSFNVSYITSKIISSIIGTKTKLNCLGKDLQEGPLKN